MKKIFSIIFSILLSEFLFAQQDYTQFVNPFIGTGGHGHTYPGATVPFGAVQLSPDTKLEGWDGCSGYHYSDSIIYGFSHTHLSGTGIPDLCDIMFMPMSGSPSIDRNSYSSKFFHKSEIATPGYYSVLLDDEKIKVELTATERAGFHRYTFSQTGNNHIILDLKHRDKEDKVLESSLKIISSTQIEGMRRSQGWALNQVIYFAAEFSQPFDDYKLFLNDSSKMVSEANGTNIKSIFTFEKNKVVLLKVGISTVSIEGARKNLKTEISDWNFDQIKNAAKEKWNQQLSKIEISGGTQNQKTIFYTALYHTMVVPVINMDVDGKYRGHDNQVHQSSDFTNYSIFSLWDTFRAAHPLYTIIEPARTSDFIKTFLAQYDQGGRLPVWELLGNETDCMIGYHSVSVITDAYAKGIRNFDSKKALEAMRKSAEWNQLGLPALMDHGYLAIEDEHESVSKTLEYSYDDWCISQFAKMNENEFDYLHFSERAQYYKNLFDSETGFMRPRKNGGWMSPFNPKEVDNNFTEANSWQYSFFVPQDISGLISLHGGKENFENKLDQLFQAETQTTGRTQADITGLIGQYAHGNEPSHHMAYLYNFIGKPWKTQYRIHQVLDSLYTNSPNGLAGNEDCGQMSAWYVLSAMGFYSVTPGQTSYIIGSPLFDEVKIHLENGKQFSIVSKHQSPNDFYIQSAKINKLDYSKSYFDHQDILNGGKLELVMGLKPNKSWGSSESDIPKTEIASSGFVEVPTIDAKSNVFRDSLKISIHSSNLNSKIFFTLDGSKPSVYSALYQSEFYLKQSSVIKAIAADKKGNTSFMTIGNFHKFPNNWSIKINGTYNHQYTAGGDDGIIDGIRGEVNWKKGGWQGYQYKDFECVLDLKKDMTVSELGAGFLQDTRSWIMMPTQVEFWLSSDGINFNSVLTIANKIDPKDYTVQVQDLVGKINPKSARYIKVIAKNFGTLPDWHQGQGDGAFIFVDEVWVK